MSFPAGELEIANIPRRIATAVSYVKSVLLFSSRDPQPAQDISNRKQTGGPSREGPPVAGVIRPQLFCEFYLQPVYPRSVR